LACEENPHPFPEEKGQQDLIKGERITNAKIRIPNQRSEENEKKEKKRKRRISNQRSEESKKEKIGGKQNNSRSI